MWQLERQNYRKNVQRFQKERVKLLGIVGEEFEIHHVGSTAIPRMSGKNILDILIGVPNLDVLEGAIRILVQAGYFLGKSRDADYAFLASREEETRSGDTHIHLGIVGSQRYDDFLSLKNYMLKNPSEAKRYRSAKFRIARKVGGDRSDYKKEKSEYATYLLKKARCYHKATKNTNFCPTKK